MKKVLFICRILPQYRLDFFQRLRNELFRQDIELQLIYGKANETDALKKDEIDIEWAHYIRNQRLMLGKTEVLWQPGLKHLKDKNLVIVQTENKLILNYYLIFARHFAKYKLGFWGPAKNMREDSDSLPNKFRFLFLSKCDWWFGYTEGVKKFLLSKKFPENKITVIQNAIDTHSLRKQYSEITDNELNNLKDQLGIKSGRTGIYCGAMYPRKNLDFVLEACYRIKKEIPDFNMIFIGSGIEASKVIKASNNNNWIHYVGPKFGNERVKYFKISAIQLMPRLVGLGILDSFAMETPIITTANPYHGAEFDYLENGINGIVTKDDIDDYSKITIDLLKNDKQLELIEGCRSAAEKYTVEKMVENFKNGILSSLNS